MQDDSLAAGPLATPARRFSGWQLAFFVLLATVLAATLTLFIGYRLLFPGAYRPTELSEREQATLDTKLGRLEPQAYSEAGAERTLRLSERELNALVARNPDLARRLAIDLSDDLASARLLLPLPPDFPLFGGQTLQVTAGLGLAYGNGRPEVQLRGISVMGVPLPNAWLGGLKNVDLVEEFGSDPGFWQSFAAGIEDISVEDSALQLELTE